MRVRALATGLASFVPGLRQWLGRGTGGTVSARYCYSVWLRHLTMAARHGFARVPRVVAELGPGDTLGTGMAALLSGAERYSALDVVRYATGPTNLRVFDELVGLFRARTPIPDQTEFPHCHPRLESYDFPNEILTEDRLAESLAEERVVRLRRAVAGGDESVISYRAPWSADHVVEEGSVEMLFSQAVLEHVDDLPGIYRAMCRWVAPWGIVSHEICFHCHETSHDWNGHWTCSDLAWRLISGRRAWTLNREPHSTHRRLLEATGFRTIADLRVRAPSRLARNRLAPRFRHLTDDDLTTCSAFLQATKAA